MIGVDHALSIGGEARTQNSVLGLFLFVRSVWSNA